MRIAVLGASGFLGSAIVRACVANGDDVCGFSRTTPRDQTAPHRAFDLLYETNIAAALSDFDLVIHAASSADDRWRATTAMTRRLCDQLAEFGGTLVLISSLAVIDYARLPIDSVLDESAQLISSNQCSGYAREKRIQEQLFQRLADAGVRVKVLRPGTIVGPGHWWSGRLGVRWARGRWVQIGGENALPVIGVERCGRMVRASLDTSESLVHLIEHPTQTVDDYVRQRIAAGDLNTPILRCSAGIARQLIKPIRLLAKLGLPKPEVLDPHAFEARYRRVRFVSRSP